MYVFFLFQQQANCTVPMAFVAFGGEDRTKLDVGGFAEQAGLGQPLAANFLDSESMLTMTEKGSGTGIGGSSEKSIRWRGITGEAVGWEKSLVLVQRSECFE